MSISGSIIKKLNESSKFAGDLSRRYGPTLMELADTDDNEGFVKYFENNISDIVNSFDEIVNFLKNNNCYSGLDLLYDCMHDYDDYIKSHHLKESNYTDDIDDLGSYMYDPTDYSIPSYDEIKNEYSDNITKSQYNKLHNKILDFYKLPRYEGELQLSDEPVLSSREFNDIGLNDYDASNLYTQLVDDAGDEFKEQTGVELHLLGRSGRHACVDDTYSNASRFTELQQVQSKLVDELVDKYNNYKGEK